MSWTVRTGRKLEEYPTTEEEVLKNITKVFAARRAAGLRLLDMEETDQGLQRRIETKRKSKAKTSER